MWLVSIRWQWKPIIWKAKNQRNESCNFEKEKLYDIIKKNKVIYQYRNEATHIFFYGAGCGTKKPRQMLKGVLEDFFQKAKVDVKEDTYAAVYATVGNTHKPAVVCILGTGSNCSYYDGDNLHQRVNSLGYTIMDDASGNYYGKQLIRDYYYNHMPHNIRVSFEEKHNLESDFIKYNLYKQPNPNAYLANFAEFMFLNKESEYVQKLIKDGIRLFARNMIFQYREELKTVPVHFAGSIAFFGQQEIREVGKEMGFEVGVFERRPIEGLVKYHTHNLQVLK